MNTYLSKIFSRLKTKVVKSPDKKKDISLGRLYNDNQYLIKCIKESPYHDPLHLEERDGKFSLNASHQSFTNSSGWFTKKDLLDWYLKFQGPIVKGKNPAEKAYVGWCLKRLVDLKQMNFLWDSKHFHLVPTKAPKAVNERYNTHFGSNKNTPLKIHTGEDEDYLILMAAKWLYSFAFHSFESVCDSIKYHEEHYGVNSDSLKREFEIIKRYERESSDVAYGLFKGFAMLGCGHFDACNTPTTIYNFSWYRDLIIAKALYDALVDTGNKMPDFKILHSILKNS